MCIIAVRVTVPAKAGVVKSKLIYKHGAVWLCLADSTVQSFLLSRYGTSDVRSLSLKVQMNRKLTFYGS